MKTIEEQLSAYGDHLDELAPPDPAARARTRPTSSVAAAAIAVLVMIGGIVLLRHEEPSTPLTAGGRPVTLVPNSIPADATLGGARQAPFLDDGHAIYGDAASQPGAVITVNVTEPGFADGRISSRFVHIDVAGEPATLDPDRSALMWDHDGVGLMIVAGPTVDLATLLRFAAGVTVGADRSITAAWLPSGWIERWDGTTTGPIDQRSYTINLDEHGFIAVTTWTGAPDGGIDAIAPSLDARTVDVRGKRAHIDDSDERNPSLWWQDVRGVVVLVQYSGGDEQMILAFADTLVPADQAAWNQFVANAAPPISDDIATTSANRHP